MSRNAKILIDLAVLAAVYGIWLLPKWRPLGRRTLTVYTLMYGCLALTIRMSPCTWRRLRMSFSATAIMFGRSC